MLAVSMNVTPRSTVRCSVANDSASSTSPYTGVSAMAPKPIALTVNSSPNSTVGTVLALVMACLNDSPSDGIPILLRDDDDPGGVRELLQRATAVALRPWT